MSDLEQRINLYLSNTSTTAMGIDVYDIIKDTLMEFVPQETKELNEKIKQLEKQVDMMKCCTNCQWEYKPEHCDNDECEELSCWTLRTEPIYYFQKKENS